MVEVPINLSGSEVACLKETGAVDICRMLKGEKDPAQMPATGLHPAGDRYWVRERVARRQATDEPGQWFYKADGYVEGRFYLASYYMPREACRFHVVVEREVLDFLEDGGQSVWVSTAQLRVAPAPAAQLLYELDFDKIRQYSGGRHKPVFRVDELRKSDDPGAEHDDLVRLHAYLGFGEMRLPLDNYDVRQWLKTLRFVSAPLLQFGSGLVECGKEVPGG